MYIHTYIHTHIQKCIYIITTNLSRYQKAIKLLNTCKIERSLRVFNTSETLTSYCEALRKQQIPALS